MFRLFLGVASCAVGSICQAGVQGQPLDKICSVLCDTKLRAGLWAVYEDGREGCRSAVRPVTPSEPMATKSPFLLKVLAAQRRG